MSTTLGHLMVSLASTVPPGSLHPDSLLSNSSGTGEPDETVDTKYWWIGVLCSLLACFGTVSGLMLQKWSHMKNEALPEAQRRPSYKRGLWWVSLFLMILLPSPLDVASFALAPQSLLAPLAAVTLLLNALFSPCFLGEILTDIDKRATLLIFFGAALSTVFGDHTEVNFDVPGLYKLYSRPICIVTQILVGSLFVFLYTFNLKYTALKVERDLARERSVDSDSAPASPLGYESEFDSAKIPFGIRVLPFSYGCLAGISGAQQAVWTKNVSELFTLSIDGNNQVGYALFWVLTALAIGAAIFQISYVSKGLEHFDAVFYLPIYNAFLIVFGVLLGSIYFDEVKNIAAWKILLFIVGVSITVSGVLYLTRRNPRASDEARAQDSDQADLTARLLKPESPMGADTPKAERMRLAFSTPVASPKHGSAQREIKASSFVEMEDI